MSAGQKRTCARTSSCLLWAKSGHSVIQLLVSPQQAGLGTSLFDHFVGNLLEMHWHFEAQRLGGLHIDNQLELRGL